MDTLMKKALLFVTGAFAFTSVAFALPPKPNAYDGGNLWEIIDYLDEASDHRQLAFGMRNPVAFHCADGKGYSFLTDFIIELDKINPQVTSRMLTPLTQWRRYDKARQEMIRAQLQRILDGGCSKDVYEVVSKSLG